MFVWILILLIGACVVVYLRGNQFLLSLGVILTVFFIGVLGMAIVDENFGKEVDKNISLAPFQDGVTYLYKTYNNSHYVYICHDTEDNWYSIPLNSCVVERIPMGEQAYMTQLRRNLDNQIFKWLFNPHENYYMIYLPVGAEIRSYSYR